MICKGCKRNKDLRLGWCFDCASNGEKRAACRSVLGHIVKGFKNILKRSSNFQYDFKWAWERLTRMGDYSRFGYFEKEYGRQVIWGLPDDCKSKCRICEHPIWKHHHAYIFACGIRSRECYCKQYIPSDNLEYLEWKYQRRNVCQ